MSSVSCTTLAVSSNATLAGPIALTGAITANNISIPTGNFTQGTGTFSTGSGTNYLNGPVIANSSATFNTTISVQSGIVSNGQISANSTIVVAPSGYIKLPSLQILGSGITLVDTTTAQSIGGTKTYTATLITPKGTNLTTTNDCVDTTNNQTVAGTKTFSGTLITPKGTNLTTTNDCVDTTNNQTVAGTKTFSGSIVANAGVNAGANSIVCGTITSSGLISLNAGSGISLLSDATNRYKTTIYSGTDTNSYYDNNQSGGSHIFRNISIMPSTILSMNTTAITASVPLSTGANSITTTGAVNTATLTASSTINTSTLTASSTITANGGITMGSSQNITLASTFTTPTTGQLGYTVSFSSTLLTIVSTTYLNTGSITLGVGVWNIYYGIQSIQGNTALAVSITQRQIGLTSSTTAFSGYTTSLQSSYITDAIPSGGVSNMYFNYIVSLTTSTTIYLGLNFTTSINARGYGFIQATRIA